MMLQWFVLSGTAVAAVGGSLSLILFPPLPRDLGGAVDLDAEAEPLRIPVPGDGHLDGWYLRGHRPAVIVLLHGFGRTHHRAWRYASFLRRLGVHVLTFDFRSARGRGRKPTTLGHHERLDAHAVIDWMQRDPRFAGCRIGVHGESLGAAVALQLAAARPEIAAVVADGAFASSNLALEDSCERWARMPRQPSASILRAVGYACTGHDPGATDPLSDAPRLADRPVFFIHGVNDDRIGEAQVRALWDAAGGTHPLWIVAGAGHNEAWTVERAEYERRVSEFFAQHLLGERR